MSFVNYKVIDQLTNDYPNHKQREGDIPKINTDSIAHRMTTVKLHRMSSVEIIHTKKKRKNSETNDKLHQATTIHSSEYGWHWKWWRKILETEIEPK